MQLLHWVPLPQNLMVAKEIKYNFPLFTLGNVFVAIILLWPSKFLKQIIHSNFIGLRIPTGRGQTSWLFYKCSYHWTIPALQEAELTEFPVACTFHLKSFFVIFVKDCLDGWNQLPVCTQEATIKESSPCVDKGDYQESELAGHLPGCLHCGCSAA